MKKRYDEGKKETEREKKIRMSFFFVWFGHLFPVVVLGDVSELLLDGVSVDVDESEGFGGGGGETAPFQRVPAFGRVPHAVDAWRLNLLDGLLDRVEAVQERAVRLRKGDVQQLLVVVFVLHDFEVGRSGSEEHHFDGINWRGVWLRSSET